MNIAKKYNARCFLINIHKIRLKIDNAMIVDANQLVIDSVRVMGDKILEMDQLLLIKMK